ncbi:MAG: alpha/beta fold hydrolase [Candidatus Coatesbacteria bacterium]|nr:MAG: alpha/beta fold hydrolase [Candidatus Coatesbacteria bacterium]
MTAELQLTPSTYRLGEEEVGADVGALVVPENRASPETRTIEVPVVRLPAAAAGSTEPVFLLAGGPGQTNLWSRLPTGQLGARDVVMVGYRGVDGSVSLDLPEVGEAMAAPRPLSVESRKRTAAAWRAGYERLRAAGVDVEAYNLVSVVDDVEAAREALGYERLHLYSWSYGTRLAYLYGLRYPDRVYRSVMVGANPPGRFVWEAEMVERQLAYYAELWRRDGAAAARAPDLLGTIREVLASLPAAWNGFTLDADKVRVWTFAALDTRAGAAAAFDAFLSAAAGDFAGLVAMQFMFDEFARRGPNFGDMAAKAVGADFDPSRDYEAEMDPPGAVLGSPLSLLYWTGMKYEAWPYRSLPEEYRTLRDTDVATLVVSGSVDFTTPPAYAEEELLPHLRRGHHLLLAELGHCYDLAGLRPQAHRKLVEVFFGRGEVDASGFEYEPMDFTPARTFKEMLSELGSRK